MGCNGSEDDIDPISGSLYDEALRMSGFIKRIESMKKKLNSLVSGATIIYADGSRKTLSIDSVIQEYLWHSAEIERIECGESGSGLLAELLQSMKNQTSVSLSSTDAEPVTVAPQPAPAETYEDRRAYLEKRQQEIAATKPNPPSDNQHCI